MKPKAMPSAMEKVSGISRMVTAAGTYSVASSKSISRAAAIIRQPTKIERRGGGEGGNRSGERREEQRGEKQHRDGDRDEPRASARIHAGGALDVARRRGGAERRADHGGGESTTSARPMRGSEPSGGMMPAAVATPISVPVLSKTTMKKNVNTIAARPRSSAPRMSICRSTGAIDGGSDATPAKGVSPSARLAMNGG